MGAFQAVVARILAIFASSIPIATTELPAPNHATVVAINLTNTTDSALATQGIQRKLLGALLLPTGRLVAIDPISLIERGAKFVQIFPTGACTTYVYLTNDDFNGKRVVLAEIRFSEEDVVQWRLAEVENLGRPLTLIDTDYGMVVEAAIGSYMSQEFLYEIKKEDQYPSGGSFYSEYLFDGLNAPEQGTSFLFQHPKFSKANAAIFETGDSDGIYPSFVGYGANGKISKLVTSFFMLEQRGL